MTKTRNSCLLDKVPRVCNFCLLTPLGLLKRVDPNMEKVILNEEIYSGNHKVSNYLVTGHYGVTTDQFHFFEFFIFAIFVPIFPIWGCYSFWGVFAFLGG